jgi:pilus assembly protein CpaE
MYPFKAILVGEATKLDTVQRDLLAVSMEVEAAFPDASAAITWLSQAPEARRLFIMYVAGTDQLEPVKRMRSACVGQPILAVVDGAAADKEVLIHLMRAGVDQAVLLPFQPGDVRAALDSVSWQFGHTPGQAVAVAVVGVTPGSGVTTVAVNLAREIANRGRNCILVEAATRLGKLAGDLGVTPRFTTRELAAAGNRLDAHMVEQALIPVADHLRLLAAPADEVRVSDPGREIVRKFVMFLRQLAEVSILEMSYNLTETYYEGLAAVDQVLVLSRHTSSGLQDLKLVCQGLRRDHGVRTLYPVINRFDPHNRELSLAQMQEALEEPRLLTIVADRSLQDQSMTGLKVVREKAPAARPLLRDIRAISRLILGEPTAEPSETNGLFGWLKRVFTSG